MAGCYEGTAISHYCYICKKYGQHDELDHIEGNVLPKVVRHVYYEVVK